MIIKTLGEFREKFANLPDDTPLSVWDDKLEQHGDANIYKDNGGICFSFSCKEKPKTADVPHGLTADEYKRLLERYAMDDYARMMARFNKIDSMNYLVK